MPLLMPMRTRRPRNTSVAPGSCASTWCHLYSSDSRTCTHHTSINTLNVRTLVRMCVTRTSWVCKSSYVTRSSAQFYVYMCVCTALRV